ncbi:MAG: DUF86 domain-containing protein [Bacteroides sp.]|nr:DUF86 domain-containing protein [Bacteroides sp.]
MEYTLKEEILDKLEQIEESIEIIQQRIKGYQTVDDCLMSMQGMTVLDACILRIQVIGETIKSIDDKTKGSLFSLYPEIPWKKIIGLRNIISHEYANIDYDIIWSVITQHLPTLFEQIIKIKADFNQNH